MSEQTFIPYNRVQVELSFIGRCNRIIIFGKQPNALKDGYQFSICPCTLRITGISPRLHEFVGSRKGGEYLQVIPKGAEEQVGILWYESHPRAQSGQGHLQYVVTVNFNFPILQFNKPENTSGCIIIQSQFILEKRNLPKKDLNE